MKKIVCFILNIAGLFLLLTGIFRLYFSLKWGFLALLLPALFIIVGLIIFIITKKCLNKSGSKIIVPVIISIVLFVLWTFVRYAPVQYINELLR